MRAFLFASIVSMKPLVFVLLVLCSTADATTRTVHKNILAEHAEILAQQAEILEQLRGIRALQPGIRMRFRGVCDLGCIGPGVTATAILVLRPEYTMGTEITTADVVTFSYSSDSCGGASACSVFDIPDNGTLLAASGVVSLLPARQGPLRIEVDANGQQTGFNSYTDGSWRFESFGAGIDDSGTNGVWKRWVPLYGCTSGTVARLRSAGDAGECI